SATSAAAYKRSFLPISPLPVAAAPPGCSVVLTNVVSFQVQISPAGGAFADVSGTGVTNAGTYFLTGGNTFDNAGTTTATRANGPPRIAALQVTLRMWDPASGQTRQLTIVQEM